MRTNKTVLFIVIVLLCVNLCTHVTTSEQHNHHESNTDPSQDESKDDGKKEGKMRIKTYEKKWKYKNNTLFRYARPFPSSSNTFLFALCSQENLTENVICDVNAESLSSLKYNTTEVYKESCKLKLSAEKGYGITNIVSIKHFGTSMAIVTWWQGQHYSQYENHKIIVSLVFFKTCEIQHNYFPNDVEKNILLLNNVVTYPNGFDVIIAHEETCGPSITCRISYNETGHRIGEPVPFVKNLDTVHTLPTSPKSSAGGFYVQGIDFAAWEFRAAHVSPKGKIQTLMTMNSAVYPWNLDLGVTSNSNKLYGICVSRHLHFNCAQFNIEGNVTLKAAVRRRTGIQQWIAFYNLAEGEAVLARADPVIPNGFQIIKIKDGGKEMQSIDVPNLNMKCTDVKKNFSLDIIDSHKYLCFYFTCQYEKQVDGKDVDKSAKFVSKCILKKHLFADNPK